MPHIEFGSCRIAERSNGDYVPASKRVYNLENRLLEFAAVIIELTESLPNTRVGNHVAGQLLRCGTSSLSNHGEVEAIPVASKFEVGRWTLSVRRFLL